MVNTASATKVQLLSLTGIRGFLALWVVIFHQTLPNGYLYSSLPRIPDAVFCLLRTGYLAVGVFFVLSGFVLSYNYTLVKPWSSAQLARFAVARFARIYPAYCAGLILVVPFVEHLGPAKQTVVALFNWTLIQSWFPSKALSWNSPGWSLSDEAFFYCCFPLVGVALWKLSRWRDLILAASILWTAALLAPLVAVYLPLRGFGDVPATSLHPDANFVWANLIKYNPLLRMPEFCLGIIVGRAYLELRSKSSRLLGRGYFLYLPGILLEIWGLIHASSLPYPLVHNGLLTPVHCLVILGFALGGGTLARALAIRPLVFLGNASYAIYILHLPVARWLDVIFRRFVPTLNASSAMLLYVMAVIGLSAIVFKFVEEPANRILKLKLSSRFEASLHGKPR